MSGKGASKETQYGFGVVEFETAGLCDTWSAERVQEYFDYHHNLPAEDFVFEELQLACLAVMLAPDLESTEDGLTIFGERLTLTPAGLAVVGLTIIGEKLTPAPAGLAASTGGYLMVQPADPFTGDTTTLGVDYHTSFEFAQSLAVSLYAGQRTWLTLMGEEFAENGAFLHSLEWERGMECGEHGSIPEPEKASGPGRILSFDQRAQRRKPKKKAP